jgi:alpha-1,6-mannosyltransferase
MTMTRAARRSVKTILRALGRAARRVPATPYLVGSTALTAALTVIALRRPWEGDFGVHAAGIERIRESLFHPGNAIVEAATASPYNDYTPYTVGLGLLARATGGSALTILTYAAPACSAVLLVGLRRFCGVFSDDQWAPPLALAFVTLLWGTEAPNWSGFLDLRGLPLITPYPSTLATGLMLLCWTALSTTLEAPAPIRWLGVGALGGLIALIHPFTAQCGVLGAVALLAGAVHRFRPTDLYGPAISAGAAIGVVLSWPYFSLAKLASAARSLQNTQEPLYESVIRRYGFATVGLPALLIRWRRDRLDPLALLFVLTAVPLAVGWWRNYTPLARLWPVALLSVQLSLALELARLGYARARLWSVATLSLCVLGAYRQYPNVVFALPGATPHPAPIRELAWVARHTAPGETVVSDDPEIDLTLLAYGLRLVVPPRPDPFLPDEAQRWADRRIMAGWDGPAPTEVQADRLGLLRRYHVRWVLALHGGWRWAERYADTVVAGPRGARLLKLSAAPGS